jgi:hypothetical protein
MEDARFGGAGAEEESPRLSAGGSLAATTVEKTRLGDVAAYVGRFVAQSANDVVRGTVRLSSELGVAVDRPGEHPFEHLDEFEEFFDRAAVSRLAITPIGRLSARHPINLPGSFALSGHRSAPLHSDFFEFPGIRFPRHYSFVAALPL